MEEDRLIVLVLVVARRILILAPKAVCRQWQIELREKFNLNWPIYDGRRMVRYPSPALRGANEREVGRNDWHREPAVIVSSHLTRRSDRAGRLLEDAERWDMVVVDEAHHARRREVGSSHGRQRPNAMLRLLQGIAHKTEGLVLLTATPMQVHPVEVWDLLALLGLPPEWTQERFLRFFEDVEAPNPSHEALNRIAEMFRAVEARHGATRRVVAQRASGLRSLGAGKVLRALRSPSSIARRRLEAAERRAAVAVARANTPTRHMVSRHTRKLLRKYRERGMVDAAIADRRVEDRMVSMSAEERKVYEAVGTYISSTYNRAEARERNAVGFVITTYSRRLASSFQALRNTLQDRLEASKDSGRERRTSLDDDADILLCTDAASEGLNFQFCGALVNYDMPWNPMRVEQRIGRIDRLGQRSATIQIVNLHYEDTVETDVYQALRDRIGLFEAVVGRLQPILAELPRTITGEVLAGSDASQSLANRLQHRVQEVESGGFDLDEVLDEDLDMPARPESPVTMTDLDRVISRPDLMPPGVEVGTMGAREYSLLAPGMNQALRVTTDPAYYEEHAESLELWSPGNPLFHAPEHGVKEGSTHPEGPEPSSLSELLDAG